MFPGLFVVGVRGFLNLGFAVYAAKIARFPRRKALCRAFRRVRGTASRRIPGKIKEGVQWTPSLILVGVRGFLNLGFAVYAAKIARFPRRKALCRGFRRVRGSASRRTSIKRDRRILRTLLSLLVGVRGFEPPASWSRRRSSHTILCRNGLLTLFRTQYIDIVINYNYSIMLSVPLFPGDSVVFMVKHVVKA